MTPYTYFIGWSKHNKFYYGVRYAKNSNPKELWITYFTSSKHVKNYSAKYGNPDIIQIRKIFKNPDEARLWENRVLKRLKVVNNSKYLNATDNIAIKPIEFDRAKNFEKWNKLSYTEKYTIEQRENRSKIARENMLKKHRDGKITYVKPDDTTNYKNAAKLRWSNPEFKALQKSRKWINDGIKSKMVLSQELSHYLNSGWNLGRVGG